LLSANIQKLDICSARRPPVDQYQVLIVGAGPVGSRIATELALRDISVLLVEEHSEIGRPFQCAGLVNPSSMEIVGLTESILQNIDGAKIHSPSGTMVQVGTEGRVRTHVVCRKRFDQGVTRQAQEAGAHLWLLCHPLEVETNPEGHNVILMREGKKVEVKCKLLIGADGAHSWVRRTFKMGRPTEMMVGFQSEVVGYESEDNWLQMYSGDAVAAGLFAWVIPSGLGTHRIGVWAKPEDLNGRSVEELYDTLLDHPLWRERFSNCKEIARYCGPIPCGVIKKPCKNRILLIGDAAGMAKPTTGGGIGPGFNQVAAIIEKLTKAINADKLSEKSLNSICKPYKELKKDQAKARALRDLLVTSPSDEQLDSHFEMFNRKDVLELINSEGDIEHPVILGMALLRKVPKFRKLAVKAGIKIIFA
jgi:digeranylgeranylglycerophospholipid reductase